MILNKNSSAWVHVLRKNRASIPPPILHIAALSRRVRGAGAAPFEPKHDGAADHQNAIAARAHFAGEVLNASSLPGLYDAVGDGMMKEKKEHR
jgi:hypothetical protein